MISPIAYVLISFLPAGMLSLILEALHRFQSGETRLPIKDRMLRPPGESSRRRMEHLNEKIGELKIWIWGFPTTFLICYLSNSGTTTPLKSIPSNWLAALWLALFISVVFLWKLAGLVRERNNWRQSFSSQRAVGEQLNLLMCEGCRVLHDFPLPGGDHIDHVVIAPAGVFAIETEARQKSAASPSQQAHEVIFDGETLEFPGNRETGCIERAEKSAVNLGAFLSEAMKSRLEVKPVVTMPGWYVIQRGSGNVAVVNPKMIEPAIFTPNPPVFRPEKIREIAAILEQKCQDDFVA